MKLTRDERQALEKATLKERVERLEEYVDFLSEERDREMMDKFNKEMDEINEKSDVQCMWALIIGMLLIWWFVWALITKLCI